MSLILFRSLVSHCFPQSDIWTLHIIFDINKILWFVKGFFHGNVENFRGLKKISFSLMHWHSKLRVPKIVFLSMIYFFVIIWCCIDQNTKLPLVKNVNFTSSFDDFIWSRSIFNLIFPLGLKQLDFKFDPRQYFKNHSSSWKWKTHQFWFFLYSTIHLYRIIFYLLSSF